MWLNTGSQKGGHCFKWLHSVSTFTPSQCILAIVLAAWSHEQAGEAENSGGTFRIGDLKGRLIFIFVRICCFDLCAVTATQHDRLHYMADFEKRSLILDMKGTSRTQALSASSGRMSGLTQYLAFFSSCLIRLQQPLACKSQSHGVQPMTKQYFIL